MTKIQQLKEELRVFEQFASHATELSPTLKQMIVDYYSIRILTEEQE